MKFPNYCDIEEKVNLHFLGFPIERSIHPPITQGQLRRNYWCVCPTETMSYVNFLRLL